METLATLVWVVLLIAALVLKDTVKMSGRPVENPIVRVLMYFGFLFLMSLLFVVLGYVGRFMLSPLFPMN